MNAGKRISYAMPEEISASLSGKVLASLNTVRSSEELAAAIEIPGERDVGQKVAKNILIRRTQLGGFKDLRQCWPSRRSGPKGSRRL